VSIDQSASFVNSNVTVEVTGQGADARRIARVGDWTLTAFVGRGDDEPRMSIADVAQRVGQPAIRLRRTARGLKSERFSPVAVCLPSIPGKRTAFEELYLSEAEILYLLTKLRTPQAEAITWDMIEVYKLARRGLLPQQQPGEFNHAVLKLVERLDATQTLIIKRLDAMETRRTEDHGLIGRERARALLDAIHDAATVTAPQSDDPRAWGRRRGKIEAEVRKAARLPMGRRIEDLDAGRLGDAWLRLGELRRDAESDATARAKARAACQQLTLLDAMPPEIRALTKLS
jgi:hypothetical protein